MQIYEKLRYYINKYHYSRSSLARAIGIQPSTLTMKLNGERKLSADEFVSLCAEMGVECKTIVGVVPDELCTCTALVPVDEPVKADTAGL